MEHTQCSAARASGTIGRASICHANPVCLSSHPCLAGEWDPLYSDDLLMSTQCRCANGNYSDGLHVADVSSNCASLSCISPCFLLYAAHLYLSSLSLRSGSTLSPPPSPPFPALVIVSSTLSHSRLLLYLLPPPYMYSPPGPFLFLRQCASRQNPLARRWITVYMHQLNPIVRPERVLRGAEA